MIRLFTCMVPKLLYESHVLSLLHFASHILASPCGKLPTFHKAILMIACRLNVNSWLKAEKWKLLGLYTRMWRLFWITQLLHVLDNFFLFLFFVMKKKTTPDIQRRCWAVNYQNDLRLRFLRCYFLKLCGQIGRYICISFSSFNTCGLKTSCLSYFNRYLYFQK